jgi:lysozyme
MLDPDETDATLMKKAKSVLIRDEGIAYSPYKDTKGYWTIGVGYFIGVDLSYLKLSWDVVQKMLEEKIEESLRDLHQIFGGYFDTIGAPRQLALLSMIYSLGKSRFMGFSKMIMAIKDQNWELASYECKHSKWASDVDPKGLEGKGRDDRVAYMLRTGELHPEYPIK